MLSPSMLYYKTHSQGNTKSLKTVIPKVLKFSYQCGKHQAKLPSTDSSDAGFGVHWKKDEGVLNILFPFREQASQFRERFISHRDEELDAGSQRTLARAAARTTGWIQLRQSSQQTEMGPPDKSQDGALAAKGVDAPAHRGPFFSSSAQRGATVTRKPPLPPARAQWEVGRVRSAVPSRLEVVALTLLLPLPTPSSPPRPCTIVLSRQGSGPCVVLPGQPWCALTARGSSHGDGSSERTVRAAGESGDGHDGPQLHPALSARSPQGSWGLAPRACPDTLPPAQPSRRRPRGPWTSFPNPEESSLAALRASFPLPAFSDRRACPFPGTLRSLATSGDLSSPPLTNAFPRPFPHFCSLLSALRLLPQLSTLILFLQAPHPLSLP